MFKLKYKYIYMFKHVLQICVFEILHSFDNRNNGIEIVCLILSMFSDNCAILWTVCS